MRYVADVSLSRPTEATTTIRAWSASGPRQGTQSESEGRVLRPLLRLLAFLRPYWYLTAGAYVCVVLNAIFTLVVPSLLGQAVDEGIARATSRVVAKMGILILAASILRGLAAFAQGYLAESSAQGVSYSFGRRCTPTSSASPSASTTRPRPAS